MTIPLADQIKEAKRELAMRERLYPGWIAKGTLKQADADRQLERMRAVLHTLLAMEWIAVDDRLPDDDTTVLVSGPNDDVWIGWHDGDGGWKSVDASPIEVTHWAEMPEGPK